MASSEESLDSVEEVEVVVGTYEEFVLGYKLAINKEDEEYGFSISFTNHTQTKSIRSITTIGKFIAAGSADESINLINIGARVEHGNLQQQSGTITCLCDHNGNYLFSGCEDGTICIWKKGSWLCEKTLKAHIGGVIDLSVHPSGKLALSIGKDKAMKTWNLVKGRCGYVTNLKAVADAVKWSPEGTRYVVSLPNRVDVYSLQTAKVIYSIPVGKRITCISFPNESTIMIAGDKETVEVHDIDSNKKLCEFACHKIRVKAIKYVPELSMLFTASNDGFIKVWSFPKNKYSKTPKLLAEIDTSCRITCMDIWLKPRETANMEVDEEEAVAEEEEGSDVSEEDSSENDDDDDNLSDEDEEDEEEEPEKETIVPKKRSKLEKEPVRKKPAQSENLPQVPKQKKRKQQT